MKFCIYMATVCMASALLAEDATNSVATSATAPAPAATSVTAPAPAATEEDVNDDEPAEQAVVAPGFERFKTIMDRNPFGRPPPGFNPDAPGGASDMRHGAEGGADAAAAAEASEVEQQIISSVRVSVLNVTPSGKVNVGFTDSSVQPPRNYLMEVGEKREGCEWQVIEADPEKLSVKLSKDGVEATLMLGGGSGASDAKKEGEEVAKGPGSGPVPGPGMHPGMRPGMRPGMPMLGMRRPPLPGAAGAATGAADGAMEGASGLDIARARRQERIKQMQVEAEQQRQAAEQAKREREQERQEREQAAEERKAQLAQLMQIQEELRRQREEKEKQQAEAEAARQAADAAPQQQEPQD